MYSIYTYPTNLHTVLYHWSSRFISTGLGIDETSEVRRNPLLHHPLPYLHILYITTTMLLITTTTRPLLTPSALPTRIIQQQQLRHASLLRRPKRPYTFTQLITLSDGSTFTHRTTSPQPIYKSTRDTKNSVLWNPSSQKLLNIEEDEAGRLKRFRKRFGRGFDAEALAEGEEVSRTIFVVDMKGVQCGVLGSCLLTCG